MQTTRQVIPPHGHWLHRKRKYPVLAIFGTFSTGFHPPKSSIIPCIGRHNVVFQFKVAIFCNSRSPLYWVLAVLNHVPIQCHEFQYKVTIFSNSRLPLYWVLAVLRLMPIQGHKFQYKVTTFCNSRLTLYWSQVLVKCL